MTQAEASNNNEGEGFTGIDTDSNASIQEERQLEIADQPNANAEMSPLVENSSENAEVKHCREDELMRHG